MKNKNIEIEIDINLSDEYVELCGYFLLYANNLKANWLYSQKVFQEKLMPYALKNPSNFAAIVDDMVYKSGEKIKLKGLFKNSIEYIKNFTSLEKAKVKDLSKAVNNLLESGLKSSIYAQNAILNLSAQ